MPSFDPFAFLASWAGGLAAAAAVVAWWSVARTGFLWLAAASSLLLGAAAAVSSPVAAVAAVATAAAGVAAGRNRMAATALFSTAAVGWVAAAMQTTAPLPAITGAAALGGVTAEMILGHWYLVDPQLPRWALRRLAAAGGVGVVADAVVAAAQGLPEGFLSWAFLVLAAVTLLLLVAVWYSLGEPGYSGVMAATGLSYLAVLTVAGAVFVGRVG